MEVGSEAKDTSPQAADHASSWILRTTEMSGRGDVS